METTTNAAALTTQAATADFASLLPKQAPLALDQIVRTLPITSATPEEVAGTLESLQRTLVSRNLGQAVLALVGEKPPVSTITPMRVTLRASRFDSFSRWQADLLDGVAAAFFGRVFGADERTVVLLAREDNRDAILAVYPWLIEEVRRLQNTYAEAEYNQDARGQSRYGKYKRYFRDRTVAALTARLCE